MGPDLRIAMPRVGTPRMGPPVLNTGAPVAIPEIMPRMPDAPVSYPGYTAAQNVQLQGQQQGCVGCPSLADIAPPSWWTKMPAWAKWAGGLVGLGLTVGLIVYFVRR